MWASPLVRLTAFATLFTATALVTACPDGSSDEPRMRCNCYSVETSSRVDVPDVTTREACLQVETSNDNYFQCQWNGTPVTPTAGARPGFLSPE